MMLNRIILLTIALFVASTAQAQQSPAPDFVPDYVFEGQDLHAWQKVGDAEWQAKDGMITGKAHAKGGWLMFNQSYQDVALFSRFRCTDVCNAGVLLRAESTAEGIRGVLISISEGTAAPYRVILNKEGLILEKEPLFDAAATLNRPPWAWPVSIEEGAWNNIEVFVNENQVQNHLNGSRQGLRDGVIQEVEYLPVHGLIITPDGYGPVGLYVGSGDITFDDVALKDLNMHIVEPERLSARFEMQRISEFYYAWAADAIDLNQDGIRDIIAGPFYYLGPDYTTRYEHYPARTFNPGLDYALNMITLVDDWTGDGWADILVTEMRPMVLRVNPRGESRRWDRVEALIDVCGEIALSGDLDSDGKNEVAFIATDGRLAYGEPNPENPLAHWKVHKVSQDTGFCSPHGLGIGDVNGDGREDLLTSRGWWEQPAQHPGESVWVHHEAVFGRFPEAYGGGQISVYDFNGDGLNDVIATLEAHGWGLAWYEQQQNEAGEISFVQHILMDSYATKNVGDVTFSQAHAGAVVADIDGDGVKDFVTGKRHWAHLDSMLDPDPQGEAVLYWYKTIRNLDAPGGVEFQPELIHNKSGVGSEVKVLDVNQDGTMDIVTAGTRGVFVFWGVKP